MPARRCTQIHPKHILFKDDKDSCSSSLLRTSISNNICHHLLAHLSNFPPLFVIIIITVLDCQWTSSFHPFYLTRSLGWSFLGLTLDGKQSTPIRGMVAKSTKCSSYCSEFGLQCLQQLRHSMSLEAHLKSERIWRIFTNGRDCNAVYSKDAKQLFYNIYFTLNYNEIIY